LHISSHITRMSFYALKLIEITRIFVLDRERKSVVYKKRNSCHNWRMQSATIILVLVTLTILATCRQGEAYWWHAGYRRPEHSSHSANETVGHHHNHTESGHHHNSTDSSDTHNHNGYTGPHHHNSTNSSGTHNHTGHNGPHPQHHKESGTQNGGWPIQHEAADNGWPSDKLTIEYWTSLITRRTTLPTDLQ